MSAPTFDEAATSEHRRIFSDRKCEAGNATCRGPVLVLGESGRQLCGAHLMAWDEYDFAGRYERLTTWVRAQRADVLPREGSGWATRR